MNFSKNKSIILIVLSTLFLSLAGIWLIGGKSSFNILSEITKDQSSGQSAKTDSTFDEKTIDDEIRSIDKIAGDIKTEDLTADIISDEEVGLD